MKLEITGSSADIIELLDKLRDAERIDKGVNIADTPTIDVLVSKLVNEYAENLSKI